jgi:hypothetical protein
MMPRDPHTLHVRCDDIRSGVDPEIEKKKSGPRGNEIKERLFPS